MAVESPRERAMWSSGPDLLLAHVVRNIDEGATDFQLLVKAAQSTDEACALREIIAGRILKLEAAESAARHRADVLSGAK